MFLFNGSSADEIIDLSANGARLRLTRNLGNIVLDLNDVETLAFTALGGADTFTVNDLAGTGLTSIIAHLAVTGGAGDARLDSVIINGTAADDVITVTLPGSLLVSGLAARVVVDGFEPGRDAVRIQGLEGDDIVDASGVGTGGPLLALDGGIGNDILLGSAGSDTLTGGADDDVLLGNGGADVLDGGTGDNLVIQDGGNVTAGIVSVFGDAMDNTITISRDAAGNILSNGVAIPGATIANTALIRVFGLSGNDTIAINEAGGALPAAMLFGGPGTDTMTGGSGGDLLFGGSNNDTLLGQGGFDFLFGGPGNDTLTGGDADDQAFGEADNDRLVWNPGDDIDLNEGGGGSDTVEVNGANAAETFTTTANGTRVRFDRLDPAPFALDIGTCENLVVNANGGNDSFSATGNLAALIGITVDGGAGDDTLQGSIGADVLRGGDDNDFIDGNQGNDVMLAGAGDDVFRWDPGDGSDTIKGQGGTDTLLFNGSAADENIDLSANGARLRLTRNLGNIVMDVNDVERVDVNALGGADNLIVNDLAGTGVTQVNLDLAAIIGGGAGDARPDTITINGTAGADAFNIAADSGAVKASSSAASVRITRSEAVNDHLIINGLAGRDTFTVGAGVSALVTVTTNQN
ncbi:MAG: hypothetical protein L0Z50_01820 [Verrucomicrobiales bacterium]|nr:hypothetical protein [Verrucomicrobiales bacterium]